MAPAGPLPTPQREGPTLHPLAWWAWAGGVAVALTRVGNPVVLIALITGVVLTAAVCREPAPAAGTGRGGSIFTRTLEAALVLGAVIILVRTGMYVLVGLPDSTRVILDLPSFDLPWFTNLDLLGPLHFGGFVHALIEGVRLAGLVIVFGAASAVSNPRRALRYLPSSLHHLGTAAVIAVAAAPQLVASVGRIRRAQRLRAPAPGRRTRFRGLLAVLIPVLSGALDHSLVLAGSMDSRGYARATRSSRGVGVALTVALLAAAAGTYGLLDTTTPPALSLALLIGGSALAVGASVAASRSVTRTRYRETRWGWRESLLGVCALAITVAAVGATGAWATSTLGSWRASEPWPTLPPLGALMALAALAPLATRVHPRPRRARPSETAAAPGAAPLRSAAAPPADIFPVHRGADAHLTRESPQ